MTNLGMLQIPKALRLLALVIPIVRFQVSQTYLKEIETIKTCDINISDSESQGGVFCYCIWYFEVESKSVISYLKNLTLMYQ